MFGCLFTRSRKKGADDSEKDIPHTMVEAKVSVNFLYFPYGLGQASEVPIRFNYWKLEMMYMLVHLKAAQASYIYDVYLIYTVPGKH